jgi:cell division protein FtsB
MQAMTAKLRFLPAARFSASFPVTVSLFVLAGLLAAAVARVALERVSLASATRRVQREIAQLSAEQATLEALVARLQTPQALEADARLRLNVARPGETLVILPEAKAEPAATPGAALVSGAHRSMILRWFAYFFSTP